VLIRELLREGEITDDVKNDLMDFIITYKNKNQPLAPMSGANGAVEYMRNLDHDMTVNDIMTLLSNEPFTDIVERSGPEQIKLKTIIPDHVNADEKEKEEKKLVKTADNVADTTVKSGALA